MATLKQTAIDNVTSTGAQGSYTFTPTSENDAIVVHIDGTALDGKDLAFFGIGGGAWSWNGPSLLINKFTDNSMRVWLLNSAKANVYHIFDVVDDLTDIELVFNPYVGVYFNGTLIETWAGQESVKEDAITYFQNIFKTGNTTALQIGFGQGFANTTGTVYSAKLYEYADTDYPGNAPETDDDSTYLNYTGLAYYDTKIKAYIDEKTGTTSTGDVILTAPDGTKYLLSINNNGKLTTTKVTT